MKSNYIKALFTREQGYTEIECTVRYPHKKAIQILNSFTPQGSSPEISLRIGSLNDMIGIGYYRMNNESEASLFTSFTKHDEENMNLFLHLPKATTGNEQVNFDKIIYPAEHDSNPQLLDYFDNEMVSSLLYSIMAGDNIIVIHEDHEKRLEFFREFLSYFPIILLKYNRLTTNCTELDGNENIIGVSQLPKKYRSHDKLHLSLDTIFVDLAAYTISGGGLKRNEFSDTIAELIRTEANPREIILEYIQSSTTMDENYKSIMPNYHLIQQLRVNLGIEEPTANDWLTSF